MRYTLIPLLFLVAACDEYVLMEPPRAAPPSIDDQSGLAFPDDDAVTVEDFDTTTNAQREAATSPPASGTSLGTTVATLGDAGTPGFWLETPLVSAPTTGRVRNPATGRTVQVDLRPASGGSSRISLAAMRLLEAPLTELVSLEVYLNG